jgi:hypothetical protein
MKLSFVSTLIGFALIPFSLGDDNPIYQGPLCCTTYHSEAAQKICDTISKGYKVPNLTSGCVSYKRNPSRIFLPTELSRF